LSRIFGENKILNASAEFLLKQKGTIDIFIKVWLKPMMCCELLPSAKADGNS
jgi:hypothetical protein